MYVNGEMVPESRAVVSVLDRGFRWGDSVYDSQRTFGGKVFKLQSHMKRLYRSLHYTRIDPQMTIEEMGRATEDVVDANLHLLGPNGDFSVSQVVSRGLMYRSERGPNVAIYCQPIGFREYARQYVDGIRVVTPSTRRIPPQSLSPKAKIGNKMNHLIVEFEARDRDPEAVSLMLDLDGNIAECTGGNFLFVADGRLKIPNRRHVLPGIGMETVLELAENQGIPIDEDDYTPFDVYQADEAFMTSSRVCIMPARSVNGWHIGDELPGPVTAALSAAYSDLAGLNFVDQALSPPALGRAGITPWLGATRRDQAMEKRMATPSTITIPARKGKAAFARKGDRVKLINTHGQQVVDTWAFNRDDLREYMSMEHSRVALGRLMARVGDTMVTNLRRPILTIVEDTTPGIHDTLMAACDRYRYEQMGAVGYHDNCTDNLAAGLRELGYGPPETPGPWNVFMNIPWEADGSLSLKPPVCKPGDYILLRAEMDCIVAFSTCPQDLLPINGEACTPTEAHFQVLPS